MDGSLSFFGDDDELLVRAGKPPKLVFISSLASVLSFLNHLTPNHDYPREDPHLA